MVPLLVGKLGILRRACRWFRFDLVHTGRVRGGGYLIVIKGKSQGPFACPLPDTSMSAVIEAWGGISSTDAAAASSGLGALYAGTGDFSRGVSDASRIRF
jgi:hypothetical protein